MDRKITKVILIMICISLMSASVAFAANKSGTFSYNNKVATAILSVTWNITDPDYGKARTQWPKDNTYNVTVYLEAQDSPSSGASESKFDSGYEWGECNIARSGVWRYNSTHGIALPPNLYQPLSSYYLTDW